MSVYRQSFPCRTWVILVVAGLLCSASGGAVATSTERSKPAGIEDTWTGDLDGMLERNRIRVLVAYSKTFYFIDRGRQRGLVYELLKGFEKAVNEQYRKRSTVKVQVVFLPVPRDQLISGLIEGRGDIAAANLTITPQRQATVDFSVPTLSEVSELVVTGPGGAELRSVEDLSGKAVHVRRSSSYYNSLLALNERLRAGGRPEVELVLASEYLEDEDLLEMVNAGLVPIVIVDRHKAQFWATIFDDIKVHEEIAVRTGAEIGWAFRKSSPKLAAVVNAFVEKNRKGSMLGNVLLNRYLKSGKYVRKAYAPAELEKFERTLEFFRRYADQYDADWLILAALGYQESTLDQSKRSHAGAVGIMQLLPSTAADHNVGIPDIHDIESNIHAGVKYLRFLNDRYFAKEPGMDELNKWLFTFASYNAGPARVRSLREEARKNGQDPNVWFRNVEVVAAKRIGRETVQYVSNIYKYYIAYSLIVERDERIRRATQNAK